MMLSSRYVLSGKLSVVRLLRPSPALVSGIVNVALSTSTLSTKQELKGFTIKDRREPRKRVAKEKRNAYLAWRKAAFQAEHEKMTSLGLDWGIRSALLLERLPVIVEDYADWQRDFWNLQAEQARYGAEYPAEMGFKYSDEKPFTMEEILERSPIPLAPRRTEADKANDRTTLDRALDERLVLIIKPTPSADWRLPETGWEVRTAWFDRSLNQSVGRKQPWIYIGRKREERAGASIMAGETIRQAAERNARQLFVKIATTKGQPDEVTQLYFVGNCPAGWFWRTANEDQWTKRGTFGDKVFINKAQLICGQPNLIASVATEHLWVTKDEIEEYLGEEMGVYLKHVI